MVRTAGRCLRRTHVRLMHLTSGVCVCCLASGGTNLYGMMMYGGRRRLTKQPKLTAIIQSRRLTLFGHIMRMDDNADAKRILLASPPADWRRQLGRPRIRWLSTIQQDLKHHHLTLPKAADLAQNRPLWRMMSMYGATQSWVACQKRRRYYCMVGKNSSNSIPSILCMAGKNQRIFTCHTLVWKRIACCVFSLFCLVTDISATVAPVSMKLYHWGSPNHKFWA